MNKKLENQISQLSESEQEVLSEYLEKQFCVEFKGESMLRDEIRDRAVELITLNFFDTEVDIPEARTFKELELDAVDITALSEMLIVEFELDNIEFSEVMKWQSVKDIVNCIEDNLECATAEEIDWKSKPYITGFEPEP